MKNKFLIILLIFLTGNSFAENLFITAENISLDKNKNLSIFEKNVIVKTKNKELKSDYAEYDREKGFLTLKDNISIIDEKKNILLTNQAIYNENEEIIKTIGKTKVETIEKYYIEGSDLLVDNTNKIIKSEKKSTIKDQDGNLIFLENFEYSVDNNLFKQLAS